MKEAIHAVEDLHESRSAMRCIIALSGRATTIGASSTSGGIGKKEDSAKLTASEVEQGPGMRGPGEDALERPFEDQVSRR